jgi:hypothetical protein
MVLWRGQRSVILGCEAEKLRVKERKKRKKRKKRRRLDSVDDCFCVRLGW